MCIADFLLIFSVTFFGAMSGLILFKAHKERKKLRASTTAWLEPVTFIDDV
jgi:hypothetical protein